MRYHRGLPIESKQDRPENLSLKDSIRERNQVEVQLMRDEH